MVAAAKASHLAGWSFLLFFCLLCSYYVVRPVRDEMAVQAGIANLQWLFTATFFVMLLAVPVFGYASGRWPRAVLLPRVYGGFAVTLAAFCPLLLWGRSSLAPAAVFVWISVYNFFVVSVFWSLMADVFSGEQARHLFGRIAAGGSMGALVGPLLTVFLVDQLRTGYLLLVSSGLLLAAAACACRVNSIAASGVTVRTGALGGKPWDGVKLTACSGYLAGIAVFVVLLSLLATVLYFEQVRVVGLALPTEAARTRLFAQMDLAVNSLTLVTQMMLTHRVLLRLGPGGTLLSIMILAALGLAALAAAPLLASFVVVQTLRRVSEFALVRPAREILFVRLRRVEKYKAKNFVDTVVYRGGDAASGWLLGALHAVGAPTLALSIPVALLAGALGWKLGKTALQEGPVTEPPPPVANLQAPAL